MWGKEGMCVGQVGTPNWRVSVVFHHENRILLLKSRGWSEVGKRAETLRLVEMKGSLCIKCDCAHGDGCGYGSSGDADGAEGFKLAL